MSVTFATFAAYGVPQYGDETIEQLVLFTSSIRKSHGREASIVLLTDEALADQRVLQLFDVVRRRPVAKTTLLMDRTRHYRELLESHDWQSNIALLDFDILVMKDLGPVFSHQADVYLTARMWNEGMPINGGVIFLEKTRPDACRRFYEDVLNIYEKVPAEHLSWYGDQIALKHAVMTEAAQIKPGLIQTRSGAVAGIVPREEYNFTPYDVDSGQDIPQVPDPAEVDAFKNRPILHFKGPRKHLMSIVAKAAGL